MLSFMENTVRTLIIIWQKIQTLIILSAAAWGAWGSYSSCTKTCKSRTDAAKKIRYRSCNNPDPKYGGNPCPNCCDFETANCDSVSNCPVITTFNLDQHENWRCPNVDEAITYIASSYSSGSLDRDRRVKCGTVLAPGRRDMNHEYHTGWLHDWKQDRGWYDVSWNVFFKYL